MSIKIPAKLRLKWKKKLRASGFTDIEDDKGHFVDHREYADLVLRLRGGDTNRQREKRPGHQISNAELSAKMEAMRDYYYWASGMVHHGRFQSVGDKKIWTLHAQGLSTRSIAESVPFDQTHIARKIKKIREYLKQQAQKEREDDDRAA